MKTMFALITENSYMSVKTVITIYLFRCILDIINLDLGVSLVTYIKTIV